MDTVIIQGFTREQLLEDVRALIRFELSQAKPTAEEVSQAAGDDLLTIKQAAELLDVCVATVHEYKRRGILSYQKLAGRTYIKRSAVLAAGTQHQRSVKPARLKVS
jgi:DNA-directed RNA polymerase specialized sigma24 family protein